MKITIVSVGKLSKGEEAAMVARYAKRHRRFHIKSVELPESDKTREAAQILSKCAPGGLVIALDERGASHSSRKFAEILGDAENKAQSVTLVIGGPDGLDGSVRARANHTLSFGAMTWPHQLVRVLLAEQIYRAETILNGHPYHRD